MFFQSVELQATAVLSSRAVADDCHRVIHVDILFNQHAADVIWCNVSWPPVAIDLSAGSLIVSPVC